MNFDQDPQFANLPPLDKMRKVRREIVKTINDFRAGFGRKPVHIDHYTNEAAFEYAHALLKERTWDAPEESVLDEICQHVKIIQK